MPYIFCIVCDGGWVTPLSAKVDATIDAVYKIVIVSWTPSNATILKYEYVNI